MMKNNKDIWYGFLHVRTTKKPDELFGDVKGAYVNVIGMAHTRNEFITLIKKYLYSLGLKVVSITDVSTLDSLFESGETLSEDLNDSANTLKNYGHIRFGTFHTY